MTIIIGFERRNPTVRSIVLDSAPASFRTETDSLTCELSRFVPVPSYATTTPIGACPAAGHDAFAAATVPR